MRADGLHLTGAKAWPQAHTVTPDRWSFHAEYAARHGSMQIAIMNTLSSIRSRASWAMINGKWVHRDTLREGL